MLLIQFSEKQFLTRSKDAVHSSFFKVLNNVFKSIWKHNIICSSSQQIPLPLVDILAVSQCQFFPCLWNFPPTFLHSQYKPPWFRSHHGCWPGQSGGAIHIIQSIGLGHHLCSPGSAQLHSLLTRLTAVALPSSLQAVSRILASPVSLPTWSWHTPFSSTPITLEIWKKIQTSKHDAWSSFPLPLSNTLLILHRLRHTSHGLWTIICSYHLHRPEQPVKIHVHRKEISRAEGNKNNESRCWRWSRW